MTGMGTVLLVIVFNLTGFLVGGAALHWFFHLRRHEQAAEWKHQPRKFQSRKQIMEKLPLVLLNGTIVSSGMGVAIAALVHGYRGFWAFDEYPIWYAILSTIGLGFWYHFTLYYWHRNMHRNPKWFKRWHWVHHRYKAPMYLDALYEHPVEAFYGALVLATPVFLVPIWAPAYFIFVAVVGVHEILDHCGANVNVPLLSRSKAHDEHHRAMDCYYGQLLKLLDRVHETDHLPGKKANTADAP